MSKLLYTNNDWTFEKIAEVDKAIADIAIGTYGMDCYPNQYEIIGSAEMLDAYTSVGMPNMYHHWSYGKRFLHDEQNYKRGAMGLAYEIVINSNPTINYLMEENSMTMQTLVIAHAGYGHNNFFKNNFLFKEWTDADAIIDYVVFARRYIKQCEERYGQEKVEETLDSCHALMNHGVDRYKKPRKLSKSKELLRQQDRETYRQSQVDDLWKTLPPTKKEDQDARKKKFLSEPQENLLYFIEKNSPVLEQWQREIVRIVRKMAQYFYPQMQCLTGNHFVSNENGLIRLQDLIVTEGIAEHPGFNLLTEGNKTTAISHTYKKQADTFKITTKSGRTFTATPEHPLQVLSNNGLVCMTRLEDMSPGEYLVYKLDYDIFGHKEVEIKYPKYNLDVIECKICGLQSSSIASHIVQRHSIDIDFYKKEYGSCISDEYKLTMSKNKITKMPTHFNNDSARLFGYLSGATITDYRRTASLFKFVTDTKEIADDVVHLLNKVFGIVVKSKEYYSSYKVEFASMMLKDIWFKNISITRRHELPKFVLSLKKEYMKEYLSGFFDTRISKKSYERGNIAIAGYSDDYDDLQTLSVILTGFGIIPKVNIKERESFESIAFALNIPDCEDIKAVDYSLKIYSDFTNKFYDEIGTKRSKIKLLKGNRVIPNGKEVLIEAKAAIKKLQIAHTATDNYQKSNYAYKVKNNLLLKDTGLDCLDAFPNLSLNNVAIEQISYCLIKRLEKIKDCHPKIKEALELISNASNNYYDEIVSIEKGNIEWVYDVTVPENHLFWTDGLISHNTKVMNEGWASFWHHHLMYDLWEQDRISDGNMLEFLKSHSGVVFQPDFDSPYYQGGFNPYYLGFNIFHDIKRMCEKPTKEDEEWFPSIVGQPWLPTLNYAMENFKDESFILQYLSPHLIRKMHLFSLHDNNKRPVYDVSNIHDDYGFKRVRSILSKQYQLNRILPDIQITDFDILGDRTLYLTHYMRNEIPLNNNTDEMLKHVHTLWGFDVILESKNANTGETVETYGCLKSEQKDNS